MTDPDVYPILISMLKVFSLFMVPYQFEKYSVTVVWIKCTKFKNKFTCQFPKTVKTNILHFLVKSVVFHHLSLSWLI